MQKKDLLLDEFLDYKLSKNSVQLLRGGLIPGTGDGMGCGEESAHPSTWEDTGNACDKDKDSWDNCV